MLLIRRSHVLRGFKTFDILKIRQRRAEKIRFEEDAVRNFLPFSKLISRGCRWRPLESSSTCSMSWFCWWPSSSSSTRVIFWILLSKDIETNSWVLSMEVWKYARMLVLLQPNLTQPNLRLMWLCSCSRHTFIPYPDHVHVDSHLGYGGSNGNTRLTITLARAASRS